MADKFTPLTLEPPPPFPSKLVHLKKCWRGLVLLGCLCAGLAHAQDKSIDLAQRPGSGSTNGSAAQAVGLSSVRPNSWGSGFVVAPGYLITAYHVVRDHTRWLVGPVGTTVSGKPRWINAELVKSDLVRDLALLKMSELLPALSLTAQANIPIGLEAVAIGFPQPKLQGASRKITQGIVNGYRNNDNSPLQPSLLQISAEISQGNSGGPVLAADGTVIGMVQRKLNSARIAERTEDVPINVNYALRSSQLLEFLLDSPAQASTQNISLNKVMRPFQLYEMAQASVLAVIGLGQSGANSGATPAASNQE